MICYLIIIFRHQQMEYSQLCMLLILLKIYKKYTLEQNMNLKQQHTLLHKYYKIYMLN